MNPSIYYHSMALRKDLRSKIGENLNESCSRRKFVVLVYKKYRVANLPST